MKNNVFIIDRFLGKIVESYKAEDPKQKAQELAEGYFEKGDGKIVHEFIPTDKYPNRYGIQTATDFFIQYLKN